MNKFGKWRDDKETENKMKTTTKKKKKEKRQKEKRKLRGPGQKAQYTNNTYFGKREQRNWRKVNLKKDKKYRTSLVVQWLRIHCAMQRTWVRSLVGN